MALNVLIVNDSQITRLAIARSLDLANVPIKSVYQAGNGAEALRVLVSQPVDLVFAGIHMPVMGGVEMVERMSRDDDLWSIPVVVLSSDGRATCVDELKGMGIRACLHEPFETEAMRAIVDQVIGVSDATT